MNYSYMTAELEKQAIGKVDAMTRIYKGLTGRGVAGGPAIIQGRTVRDFLNLGQKKKALEHVQMLQKITPKMPKVPTVG